MTDAEYQAALARYRAAAQSFVEIASHPDLALDQLPTDGGWTPRRIVHHTADISLMGALRLRLMLAGVMLEYWSYDQLHYQQSTHYTRPIEPSLSLITATTESTFSILEQISPAARQKRHPLPTGHRYTAQDWLANAANHLEEHAQEINRIAESD